MTTYKENVGYLLEYEKIKKMIFELLENHYQRKWGEQPTSLYPCVCLDTSPHDGWIPPQYLKLSSCQPPRQSVNIKL